MPSQTAADVWAADNTDGLIDHFPLPMSEDTLLVLASALATKVDWHQPFEVASVKSTPGGAASWPSDVTFSKTGFTAAAVTAFGLIATGPPPQTRSGVVRTATLLFGGPHAVVAVAIDSPRLDGRAEPDGQWHGIPVFSAWVTEAVEAQIAPLTHSD